MDYFTLQFFFVLLAGLILGADKGAISVGCYVLLGLVGVPIFAAGGGIGYIFRPSFGYLVGFIVSAYVTGKVCEKLKASYKNYLLACLAGFVVTYAIGIVYKFIILNFYAHTPATLGVIFLSCFPLDSCPRRPALLGRTLHQRRKRQRHRVFQRLQPALRILPELRNQQHEQRQRNYRGTPARNLF